MTLWNLSITFGSSKKTKVHSLECNQNGEYSRALRFLFLLFKPSSIFTNCLVNKS